MNDLPGDRARQAAQGMTLDDAAIERIGAGLLDRSLPKPAWTHHAHLAAASWILLRRPELVAERDLPGIIRAYNAATGVPNSDTRGYHHTITLASLGALRQVISGLPRPTPAAAMAALLASRYADKAWPLAHWTQPTLFSPAARRGWVAPDLAPLPFATGACAFVHECPPAPAAPQKAP